MVMATLAYDFDFEYFLRLSKVSFEDTKSIVVLFFGIAACSIILSIWFW